MRKKRVWRVMKKKTLVDLHLDVMKQFLKKTIKLAFIVVGGIWLLGVFAFVVLVLMKYYLGFFHKP